MIGLSDGRRLVRWWKNTFEFMLTRLLALAAAPEASPPPLAPAAEGAGGGVTRLAGWGFLNSCLGIWPKLLMKPMVALRWSGSSMAKMSTLPS